MIIINNNKFRTYFYISTSHKVSGTQQKNIIITKLVQVNNFKLLWLFLIGYGKLFHVFYIQINNNLHSNSDRTIPSEMAGGSSVQNLSPTYPPSCATLQSFLARRNIPQTKRPISATHPTKICSIYGMIDVQSSNNIYLLNNCINI